jgi:hypothetical protein
MNWNGRPLRALNCMQDCVAAGGSVIQAGLHGDASLARWWRC